jgi:hippurate hydrolase
MIEDGLMERFSIDEVYGMHNLPGLPVGRFAIRPGGIMAATDEFNIVLEGKGGHAAMPHKVTDPVVAAAQLVLALQTIVSRNVDPLRSAVLSVTMVQAGNAFNVVPRNVRLTGTIRTMDEDVREFMERRLREVTHGIAATFGATAEISYRHGYPPTVNAASQTAFAAQVARSIAGEGQVDDNADGLMAGEDFSYMLRARPGAFIFLGNGDTSPLHSDTYDFDDEAIPVGVSYWVKLIETALPVEA